MSNANGTEKRLFSEEIERVFTQLDPQAVEQFYQAYRHWTLQRQIETQQLQIVTLEQKIAENTAQMHHVQPSSIELSILAQLQASGVLDIDLLDRMLERGEDWLDHTMQLLERCEELDVISDDYTQWCENALEGAYDWIDSMHDAATETLKEPRADEHIDSSEQVTEELLLRKLMSEEGSTDKIPVIRPSNKITQPLPEIHEEPAGSSLTEETIVQEVSAENTTEEEPLEITTDTPTIPEEPVLVETLQIEQNELSATEIEPLLDASEAKVEIDNATVEPLLGMQENPTEEQHPEEDDQALPPVADTQPHLPRLNRLPDDNKEQQIQVDSVQQDKPTEQQPQIQEPKQPVKRLLHWLIRLLIFWRR